MIVRRLCECSNSEFGVWLVVNRRYSYPKEFIADGSSAPTNTKLGHLDNQFIMSLYLRSEVVAVMTHKINQGWELLGELLQKQCSVLQEMMVSST